MLTEVGCHMHTQKKLQSLNLTDKTLKFNGEFKKQIMSSEIIYNYNLKMHFKNLIKVKAI